VWARFSALVQTGSGAHQACCTMGTGSFPAVKWLGRDADPSPPSSAVVKKEKTYTSTAPMGRTACTEPQFLYNGALYLYLYLYSPYGPYGLYRPSVPAQQCTLPLPMPLSPYAPYGLYRASVPVQRCTLPYLFNTFFFCPEIYPVTLTCKSCLCYEILCLDRQLLRPQLLTLQHLSHRHCKRQCN